MKKLLLTLSFILCLVGIGKADTYTLIKSMDEFDVSSDYLIVYAPATGQAVAMGPAYSNNNYRTPVNVTITDGQIVAPNDVAVVKFASTGADTYTLQVDGSYLLPGSSNNSLTSGSTPCNATLSFNTNGTAKITFTGSDKSYNQLQYNTGSPRFSCYSGTQQAVNLYKKTSDGGEVPGPSEPEPTGDIYSLIKSIDDFNVNSDYIFVYAPATGQAVAMGPAHSTNNYRTPVNVTITDEQIEAPNDVAVVKFASTGADTYTLQVDGSYLLPGSSNNSLTSGSTPCNATLSFNTNGTAKITFTGSDKSYNQLQYNTGSPRFSCYSGTQQAIYIYKKVESSNPNLTPAGLSYGVTEATAVLNQTFSAPTLTYETNATITYSSSNDKVATISNNGDVTIVALGKTVIKAQSEENDTYAAGSASYTLTVVPAEGQVLTVAEALAAITNGFEGEAQVKGVITEITEMSNTDNGSTYGNATYNIADAGTTTPTLTVYRGYWENGDKFVTGKEIEVGGTVTVSGTLVNYNGNTPEFTSGSQVVSYTGPALPEPTLGSFEVGYDNVTENSADITVKYTVEGAADDVTFTVYYEQVNEELQTVAAQSVEGDANGATINLTSLAAGTKYTYKIWLEVGETSFADESEEISFTTTAATEPEPTIPENAYIVYNDGKVADGLTQEWWWNAAWDVAAENPSGDGVVLKVNPATPGGGGPSMGLMAHNGEITGPLHDAILNFTWYATVAGNYTVRLTCEKEYNYTLEVTDAQLNTWNTTSFSVAEEFPVLSTDWEENSNLGNDYVFSIVIPSDTENTAIYFKNIYYTDVDEDWEMPEDTTPKPETVPVPTQDPADVLSIYGYYGNNVSYTVGGWGQSTVVTPMAVDGQNILQLLNFNYLGLVGFDINISDYDYMHVDYWTPDGDVPFGFVPISLTPSTIDEPIWNAPTVEASQWNSYDAKLADFNQNTNFEHIEQIKFVANQQGGKASVGYIANIYFWKEAQQEPAEPENTLVFEDFEMEVPATVSNPITVDVPISLEVEETFPYLGFEFLFTLPEGLKVSNAVLNEAIPGTAAFAPYTGKDGEEVSANTYKVMGFVNYDEDPNAEEFEVTEDIIVLTVSTVEGTSIAPGEYDVTISGVDFSTPLGQDKEEFNDFTGKVTIKEAEIPATAVKIESVELMEPSYTLVPNTMVEEVVAGEQLEVAIEITPANTSDVVEWTSSNPDVTITYDPTTGNYIVDTSALDLMYPASEEVTITVTLNDKVSATHTFTVTGVLLGDSNNNHDVTVADVVTTANYIVKKDVAVFCFPNANVILTPEDDKQVINAQDLTATVNIVLDKWDNKRQVRRNASLSKSNDRLVSDNFKVISASEFSIGVNLDNSYEYAALQARVVIPEGMKLVSVKRGPRAANHEFTYQILEDGNVRIALYSFINAPFANVEGSLFDLVVSAQEDCGNIYIDEITASDSASNGYNLQFDGGLNETATTGVDGLTYGEFAVVGGADGLTIYNAEGSEIRVFGVGGELVAAQNAGSNVVRIDAAKGIYLVVVNGVATKVIVK